MTRARGIELSGSSLALILLALLVLATWTSPVEAASPRLLKDLDSGLMLASSDPTFLGRVGGLAILVAGDGVEDDEPWVSDATEGGTLPLADICRGECGSRPHPFGQSRRAVFFSAEPSPETRELWATDGTRTGTRRILPSGATFRQLGEADFKLQSEAGHLYFAASEDGLDEQLWVSDGTPAGTQPLSHFDGDPLQRLITPLVPLGEGVVFLIATHDGIELWASDGTVAGTRRLKSSEPSPTGSEPPLQLFRAGPFVYFTATSGRQGRELWRTDGTPSGTRSVGDLVRGPRSLAVSFGATLGSSLLFVATTPQAGAELWISNGTPGGTRPLTQFLPKEPFPSSNPFYTLPRLEAANLGNRMLFLADDGVHGREAWVTDGTAAGTRLLRDINPGAASGPTRFLDAASGRAYFLANDGAHGTEIWSSDGSSAGTRMARELCSGSCSPVIGSSSPSGSSLLFTLQRSGGDRPTSELWRTDGSPAGTFRLAFDGPAGDRFEMIALGSVTLFAKGDPHVGRELWRTDQTQGGTRLLRDIAIELVGASSDVLRFMRLGSETLFFERLADGSLDLWRSDGTELRTRRLLTLTGALDPERWTEAGGIAYFFLDRNLWRSDGTAAGTFRLSPEGARAPDLRSGESSYLVTAGNRAYFTLSDAEHGIELWTSDGSIAGTRMVSDLTPGAAGSRPRQLTPAGSRLFFTADLPTSGRELWVSDGTASGTSLVRDLTFGPQGSLPSSLVVLDGLLYFNLDVSDSDIWRSDGTSFGTSIVLTRSDLPGASLLRPEAALGGELQLYVASPDPEVRGTYLFDGKLPSLRRILPGEPTFSPIVELGGRFLWTAVGNVEQMWVSEGTLESARALLDEHGEPVAGLFSAGELGGKLILRSFDGRDLWETDGTPAGTQRIVHVLPRLGFGFGSTFLIVGEKAYFVAVDVLHGAEPWVMVPSGG